MREYEANGGEGNKAVFVERATADEYPMGVLALDGSEPVGWCATEPRSRFGRGIRTPTFQGRDPAEDDSVWLVPCFLTRPDRRGQGMGRGLLAAAVELAERNGATAVEGFPFAADGPHSSSEHQVNDEKDFTSAGFAVVRRPSRLMPPEEGHRVEVHIDRLAAACGMTLTELADRAGITLANLSVLKNGRASAVRFTTLTALCDALGCQPGDPFTVRRTG